MLGPQGLRANSSLRARERQVLGSRGEGSLRGVRGQRPEHSELRSRAWLLFWGHTASFLRPNVPELSWKLLSPSCLTFQNIHIETTLPAEFFEVLASSQNGSYTITSGRQRGARRPSRPPSPPWWTRQVGASLGPPSPPGPSQTEMSNQAGHEPGGVGTPSVHCCRGHHGGPSCSGLTVVSGGGGFGLCLSPVPVLGQSPSPSALCWPL